MTTSCRLYENPDFQEMAGGVLRPGGYRITEEGMRLAGISENAMILDVGCGLGSTLAHLEKVFDIRGIGIDVSKAILVRGRNLHPELDLREGAGEELEFQSLSFDGVLMECTLSLFRNQPEALHEAYCVLKHGGKLIVSDFYLRDPDDSLILQEKKRRVEVLEDKLAEIRSKAREQIIDPADENVHDHNHDNDCGSHDHDHDHDHDHGHENGSCGCSDGIVPIGSCINGAFLKEDLLKIVEETGYNVVSWMDKTRELGEFTAEIIMNYGSMEKFWESVLPEGQDASKHMEDMAKVKLGYFLLVAEKA